MQTIKRTLSGLMLALLTWLPTSASVTPDVAGLRPFSPEANFMSQAGYLRYLVYEQQGVWLSRGEAVALVDMQIEAASR